MTRWHAIGVGILVLTGSLPSTAPVQAQDKPPAAEPEQAERVQRARQAVELHQKAVTLRHQGQLVEATDALQQSLDLWRLVYPRDKYPNGYRDLATCLYDLGDLYRARADLDRAEASYRDALAMQRRIFPTVQFPTGHPDMALSLSRLGDSLRDRGDWARAEPCYREAVEMYQRLYPADKFPDGHPRLAVSLHNLGALLEARGDLARAEPFYQDALAMCRRLFPREKYANGHAYLAAALNNLGDLLLGRWEPAQAEPYYREALAMRRQLYPKDRFPAGHPDLAASLNNLGAVLQARGEPAQAEPSVREALAMYQQLYPKDKFPAGHPDLARSFNNLGMLLRSRKEPALAEPFFRAALAMRQRLYPTDRSPAGHPDLAVSLHNLGVFLHGKGEPAQAEPCLRAALAMQQALVAAFAEQAAEAEGLNLAASLPLSRHVFLDLTARLEPADPARDYALLWQGKGALARVLQQRQRLLRSLEDEASRRRLQELLAARRQLAALTLAAGTGSADLERDRRLRDLSARRDQLERELALAIPELARQQARDRSTPADLAARLPTAGAFVDFFWYVAWDGKEHRWGEARYAAFVLRPGQPVRRVELGPAAPLHDALARWRKAIVAGADDAAAARLRQTVWDPLGLPGGTTTVWVCPDGALSALPWAALPGIKKGTVLLEECAVGVVPHGPLLYQQLAFPIQAQGPGTLLALGGVAYEKAPDAFPGADLLAGARRPDRSGKERTWPALPGSSHELNGILALARRRPQPPVVHELRGSGAGARQLLAELPQARWAHLATHGFFAAPDSAERKHLYPPDAFLSSPRGERVGVAARHPLTKTGLVLAGANRPPTGDEEGGLLTAEALAGLPLERLELAVLSACETGLGEAAAGEGVFGLQRAFHLAGTRTVLASLWKVDDEATAALMALFYQRLWMEQEPALEALRQAQLALRRHPQEISALAKERGPNFDETVKRVGRPSDPKPVKPAATAPIKHWAAFVLSGAGR